MKNNRSERSSARRRWVRLLERLVAIAVLVAIVLYVAANWSEVRAYAWSPDPLRLGMATMFALAAYSVFVLAWRRVLAGMGGQLSVLDAHRIWYFGNLARYVPGKILQIAGTAYLARGKGISPTRAVAASAVAQVFVIGVALAIALVGLDPTVWSGSGSRGLALGLALAISVGLVTPILDRVVGFALRRVDPDYRGIETTLGSRTSLLVLYLTAWLVFGVGFYLFVTGLLEPGARTVALPSAVATHAAAYAGGWLALFAPGGLGVREGVYVLLLAPLVPTTAAAAIAVAARLWLTAIEVGVSAALAIRFGIEDFATHD